MCLKSLGIHFKTKKIADQNFLGLSLKIGTKFQAKSQDHFGLKNFLQFFFQSKSILNQAEQFWIKKDQFQLLLFFTLYTV